MIQIALLTLAAALLYLAHGQTAPVAELAGAIVTIALAGLWSGYASRKDA